MGSTQPRAETAEKAKKAIQVGAASSERERAKVCEREIGRVCVCEREIERVSA